MRKKIIRHKLPINSPDLIKRLSGNQTIRFIIRSKAYLVFYNGKTYRAVLDNCPHQNKSMAGAICEDGFIICPIHKYRFSTSNGKGHGLCLTLSKIEIEDDSVFLLEEKQSLF